MEKSKQHMVKLDSESGAKLRFISFVTGKTQAEIIRNFVNECVKVIAKHPEEDKFSFGIFAYPEKQTVLTVIAPIFHGIADTEAKAELEAKKRMGLKE